MTYGACILAALPVASAVTASWVWHLWSAGARAGPPPVAVCPLEGGRHPSDWSLQYTAATERSHRRQERCREVPLSWARSRGRPTQPPDTVCPTIPEHTAPDTVCPTIPEHTAPRYSNTQPLTPMTLFDDDKNNFVSYVSYGVVLPVATLR